MADCDEKQDKSVIVIGAGVVGLTTATKIQEKGGYHVTIIAETFPSDPKSIRYTSHWAGAHHVSHAGGDVWQQKMDQETFQVMWDLSAPGGAAEGCFLRLPQVEYFCDEYSKPHHLQAMLMPDFEYLPEEALVSKAVCGISFTTVTIDTPIYLNYLLARFLAKGGTIVRGAVQHISQVVEGGASIFSGTSPIVPSATVDAIVLCAGLGARTLGGIEDKSMYPIRGQTVLLRAPWVKFGRTLSSKDGLWTYIIPRKSGDVIIGGIKVPDDWYPLPRKETTEDILYRSFSLCHELAPPEIRAQRAPTVDDLRPLIIEEGCGLRPARVGGIRLDVAWFNRKDNDKIPVIHNYGHGGYGFQSSWGSASIAYDLLVQALGEKN